MTAPLPFQPITDIQLYELLVGRGVLSEQDANRAWAAGLEAKISFRNTILKLGLLSEDIVYKEIAAAFDLPLLSEEQFDPLLPEHLDLKPDFLARVGAFPAISDDGELFLAMSNPETSETLDMIAFHTERAVFPAVASQSAIKATIDLIQRPSETAASGSLGSDVSRLEALANQGPIIELLDSIFVSAVDAGASDIHLEATDAGGQIRFRVDGILRIWKQVSDATFSAAVSRIKVLGDLNIAEKRRPQDGRARIVIKGKPTDIRISCVPTQHGESAVLRVLEQGRRSLDLNTLGFSDDIAIALQKIAAMPDGLFLVAGPTGSGKTTTLYSLLSQMNQTQRKLLTVEDPIEYSLKGVNQVPVDPEMDVGFASVLRSILRQDPDVVMVGEIRDEETASIALRAALVGRLVLSTVHANDCFSVIDRLLDLGVPRYLVAGTLKGVLSQRLIPKICKSCRGSGCDACSDSGLEGRELVAEFLRVDGKIADAISSGATRSQIMQLAVGEGFQPRAVIVEADTSFGRMD